MKKREGIFDPWRQLPQPEEAAPAKKQPVSYPADHDEHIPQHCVQFGGIRAGIFVWINAEEEGDLERAKAVVIDLVHRLYPRENYAQVFQTWGISLGAKQQAEGVVVVKNEDGKAVTITIPLPDGDRLMKQSIDNLALALREIGRHNSAADVMTALKVSPFVK